MAVFNEFVGVIVSTQSHATKTKIAMILSSQIQFQFIKYQFHVICPLMPDIH